MKNHNKWLISFAKKNSLDPKIFAERVGVSISASRSWIVNGLVPRQKYWTRIANTLNLTLSEVSDHYLKQLQDEDRLDHCQVCDSTIILWKPHIILCNGKECRRLYDLYRKRNYREILKKHTKVKYRDVNYLFSSPPHDAVKIDKNKHREEIKVATEDYLNSGGRIVYLEPGNAEGTDRITQYLISHGMENLLTE